MLDELGRKVRELSEEELLRIATTDREQYVPEALALVQREIERRGLQDVTSERYLSLKRERDLAEESARPRLPGWIAWISQATTTEAAAIRVTRQGAIAGWLIAAITFALAILRARVETVGSLEAGFSLLLSAVLYVAIGFGIWGGSLAAAVAGFAVLVGSLLYQWRSAGHEPGGVACLLAIAFLNSVRGAVALRRFRSPAATSSTRTPVRGLE